MEVTVGIEPTHYGGCSSAPFLLGYVTILGMWESNPHLTASETAALPFMLIPSEIKWHKKIGGEYVGQGNQSL